MADHARQPQPGLSGRPVRSAEAMDFFELLRRLERGGRPLRPRRPARPRAGAARPGAAPRLRRARRRRAAPRRRAARRRGSRSRSSGCFGPEGPMPLHLTPLGARPAGAALVRRRRRGRDQRHHLPRLRQRCCSTGCSRSSTAPGPTRPRRCRRSAPAAGGCGAMLARAWPAPARRRCAPASSARRRRSATRCSGRSGWPASSAPRSACRCAIEEFVGAWSAMPRAAADAPRRAPTPALGRGADARPAHLLPAEPHRDPHRPAGARRLSRLPARRRPARDAAAGAAARHRRDPRRRLPPGAPRRARSPPRGSARRGSAAPPG